MINLVTLARPPLDWAEIGNHYWRQEYASAALAELKRLSRKLGFHRLEARVHPQNALSQALLIKSDFSSEEIRKSLRKEMPGKIWLSTLVSFMKASHMT